MTYVPPDPLPRVLDALERAHRASHDRKMGVTADDLRRHARLEGVAVAYALRDLVRYDKAVRVSDDFSGARYMPR